MKVRLPIVLMLLSLFTQARNYIIRNHPEISDQLKLHASSGPVATNSQPIVTTPNMSDDVAHGSIPMVTKTLTFSPSSTEPTVGGQSFTPSSTLRDINAQGSSEDVYATTIPPMMYSGSYSDADQRIREGYQPRSSPTTFPPVPRTKMGTGTTTLHGISGSANPSASLRNVKEPLLRNKPPSTWARTGTYSNANYYDGNPPLEAFQSMSVPPFSSQSSDTLEVTGEVEDTVYYGEIPKRNLYPAGMPTTTLRANSGPLVPSDKGSIWTANPMSQGTSLSNNVIVEPTPRGFVPSTVPKWESFNRPSLKELPSDTWDRSEVMGNLNHHSGWHHSDAVRSVSPPATVQNVTIDKQPGVTTIEKTYEIPLSTRELAEAIQSSPKQQPVLETVRKELEQRQSLANIGNTGGLAPGWVHPDVYASTLTPSLPPNLESSSVFQAPSELDDTLYYDGRVRRFPSTLSQAGPEGNNRIYGGPVTNTELPNPLKASLASGAAPETLRRPLQEGGPYRDTSGSGLYINPGSYGEGMQSNFPQSSPNPNRGFSITRGSDFRHQVPFSERHPTTVLRQDEATKPSNEIDQSTNPSSNSDSNPIFNPLIFLNFYGSGHQPLPYGYPRHDAGYGYLYSNSPPRGSYGPYTRYPYTSARVQPTMTPVVNSNQYRITTCQPVVQYVPYPVPKPVYIPSPPIALERQAPQTVTQYGEAPGRSTQVMVRENVYDPTINIIDPSTRASTPSSPLRSSIVENCEPRDGELRAINRILSTVPNVPEFYRVLHVSKGVDQSDGSNFLNITLQSGEHMCSSYTFKSPAGVNTWRLFTRGSTDCPSLQTKPLRTCGVGAFNFI